MGVLEDRMNLRIEISKLASSSNLLKERLNKSQSTSDQMISILGSFDERLSALETVMRPTQIRTYAYRRTHENIDNTLRHAEEILAKFDVSRQVEPRIKEGPKRDLEGYLKAVGRLNEAVLFFSQNRQFKSSDAALQHSKDLLRESLLKLEEDFRVLITSNSKPIETEKLMSALTETPQELSVDLKSDGEGLQEEEEEKMAARSGKVNLTLQTSSLPQIMPPLVVKRLHCVAEHLVLGGHSAQVLASYREVRKNAVDASLFRLGVEKLKNEEILRMPWGELEDKIVSWNKQLKVAVLALFECEKQLSDAIFLGMEQPRDRTFFDITESGIASLFLFAEGVARSQKAPEKLVLILDMYETLRDVTPKVDVIFGSAPCAQIRENARLLLSSLSMAARETLSVFEELVEQESSKTFISDGSVHGLASYVVNYIQVLFAYDATIQELFEKEERFKPADPSSEDKPVLAIVTARLLSLLLANLEGKAKMYKDPALTQIFLMNNVHYMVQKIKKSPEANQMLGDDWVQRHRRIVQQHANQYQRASWQKVLVCLQPITGANSLPLDAANVNKSTVKERLKQFNILFDEVQKSQTGWTIPDPELRSAVQLKVAEVLVPAYRSFVDRYGKILEQHSTFGKATNPQKYIKYKPEELDALLGDLFEKSDSSR